MHDGLRTARPLNGVASVTLRARLIRGAIVTAGAVAALAFWWLTEAPWWWCLGAWLVVAVAAFFEPLYRLVTPEVNAVRTKLAALRERLVRRRAWTYVALFVTTGLALIAIWLDDVPLLLRVSAVVLFVGATLLWLWTSTTPEVIGWNDVRPALILFLIGAVIIALYFWREVDGLGLVGAIVCYLSAGQLLAVWRRSKAVRAGPGLIWLTVCSIVLVTAAAHLKDEGLTRSTAWVLALAVLALPVGVALTSEQVLRALTDTETAADAAARRQRWAWALAAVGAVIALAAILVLTISGRPVFGFWLLSAVLFVLVGLIVARTVGDVVLVAVLLLVILLGAPTEESPPPDPAGSEVLVALGDSYMSGEGASRFYAGTNDGNGNQCRRAPTAWAVRVSESDSRFDGLAFFACSGARADEIWESERDLSRGHGGPDTQLEQLRRMLDSTGFAPAMVVVSLGGNDAGFSTIGTACLAPGSCDKQEELWTRNLRYVRGELNDAYDNLSTTLEEWGINVPVVVVPYPSPLNEEVNCADISLTDEEIDFLLTFIEKLNKVGQAAATNAGFWFADSMESSLEASNLRLCDQPGGSAGINFLNFRSISALSERHFVLGNWVHNSLHPNPDGHEAMAGAFEEWLAANAGSSGELAVVPPDSAGSPDPEDTSDLDPRTPCGLAELDADKCTVQARNWAVDQSISALWPGALVPLAGLIGLWLFWLGLIARYLQIKPGRS